MPFFQVIQYSPKTQTAKTKVIRQKEVLIIRGCWPMSCNPDVKSLCLITAVTNRFYGRPSSWCVPTRYCLVETYDMMPNPKTLETTILCCCHYSIIKNSWIEHSLYRRRIRGSGHARRTAGLAVAVPASIRRELLSSLPLHLETPCHAACY